MEDLNKLGIEPDFEEWEIIAIRDLADVLNFLTGKMFANSADYCDRLRNSADLIERATALTVPNCLPDESL
jgi:hypothetical protein